MSVPLPSITSTEVPGRRATVRANSAIHSTLIDARTTPRSEPSTGDRERGHESGRVLHAVDQVVAEHELVRPKGLLKIGPVGYVEPDRARIGRAGEAAVGSGNAKPANPGNVCGQLGERTVAVRRIERHPLMSTSEDAEEGARGIDDLALRRFAAARQIDQLRAHQFGPLGAGALEAVHTFEHERNDGEEGEDDQSGADAEDRLMTPRPLRRCVARRCLDVPH